MLTPGERDALFVQYVNHAPQARMLADKADVAWGGESSIAAAIEVLEQRGARQNRVATHRADERRAARGAVGELRQTRRASTATTSGCGR